MDFEYEQDRHLRTLAKQTQAAEQAAYEAATHLAKCVRQRNILLAVNFFSVMAAILLTAYIFRYVI